jgi:uncharacterized protein (TIGR00255 family)
LLRSMTGFGAGQASASGLSVRAEIRSVNHRHLQAKLRLPGEAAHLEPELEGLVKRSLGRGAVTVVVHLTRDGGSAAGRIDEEVAEAYAKRLASLASRLGLDGTVELGDLLPLPGVVASRDDRADEKLDRLVTKAVRAALADLVTMREREGEALVQDLQKHADAIDKLMRRIGKRMPTVVRNHQANLRRRVEDLLGDRAEVSSADLARELAILADRLDVSEELSRLEAHLGQLAALLAKGGTIGRKLDFLAQEFFREANTVGSKCSDAKVTHTVVDLKTSIERLREQVQNVE